MHADLWAEFMRLRAVFEAEPTASNQAAALGAFRRWAHGMAPILALPLARILERRFTAYRALRAIAVRPMGIV